MTMIHRDNAEVRVLFVQYKIFVEKKMIIKRKNI